MIIKIQKIIRLSVIGFVLMAVLLLGVHSSAPVKADSISDLRAKTSALNAEIQANNARIHELDSQIDSLQAKLEQLQLEIVQANKQIELTGLKIAQLQAELEKAQIELDRQKELLKVSLRALYKNGNASSFELLVGSQSFSQFINQQEYLSRLKSGIQKSAEAVIQLKKQIKEQQDQQKVLLESQEAQRRILGEKEAEQQNILSTTQGEQSRYAGIVNDLRAQLDATERDLRRILASTSFVSLGRVYAGERIGSVGSSGISTGPHTHFAVFVGDDFINPRAGGDSLVFGFQFPLPASGWGDISQEFGCTSFYLEPYDPSCPGGHIHEGMDIGGQFGDPIIAAGDGDIVFRGVLGGYGNTVIIDHGNGVKTYYPHMQ